MKTRVAIVGAGIVGCAAAYHLARGGWRDVTVIDRGEIAAATTSQAAGLIGQLRASGVKTALIRQTLSDIAALCAEALAPAFHRIGSLRLALTREREAELHAHAAATRAEGVDVALISGREAASLAPGLDAGSVGLAAWMPGDGYAEPYSLATAYAASARRQGVRFMTGCRVDAILTRDGRAIGVRTAAGEITAEHVVDAAGAWTNVVAATAGVSVAVYPLRHQAWVTAPLGWMTPGFPVLRIPDLWAYARPEVGGVMLGFFEPEPVSVDPHALPGDFAVTAVARDPSVLSRYAEPLMKVLPGLAAAPIVGNTAGLPTFTPDGHFVVGAVPSMAGLVVASGCCAHGIAGSGGLGRAVAETVMGEPGSVDPRPMAVGRFGARFGDSAPLRLACERTYGTYYGLPRSAHDG